MAVPNFVELEKDILRKWKQEDVFQKTLAKKSPKGNFVFFEGPPTANGRPHIGHVETRVFKDIIPRFKTMQGYHVERKAGWDTQGLPVELEVEKTIGVAGKKDIESYGIEKFNQACRASVWRYKGLWEEMTERVGFWLDLEHPYITYENSYIETLWWILKQAWNSKLLVQDYKVVPYCYRCGTALSSHEVAQGYERVKDRAVYVKFELKPGQKIGRKFVTNDNTFILSWTTTPWTLPGNVALAVNVAVEYVLASDLDGKEFVILAKSIHDSWSWNKVNKQDNVLNSEFRYLKVVEDDLFGNDIVGLQYKPLFDFLDLREDGRSSIDHPVSAEGGATPPHERRGSNEAAYTVVPADFVTTDEGTGIVHTAVMYGEDDFQLGTKLDLPKKHTVTEQGTFNELVKPWAGKRVKDKATEDGIVQYLKEHGQLYTEEQYEHDYPFCWRCKSPLLYYAKTSWFILMSKLRDQLLANNQKIQWIPEHVRDGRFGEWLREVKDWAISRERYWGTPLPIWVCDYCQHQECLGSYEELAAKLPTRNRFIFVRHGEAENNVGRRLNTLPAGAEKFGLTDQGRREVEKTAKGLQNQDVAIVYASPYRRTRETAEIIGQACGREVISDERLHEIGIGPDFEGRTEEEFHREFGNKVDRFRRAPPGGEPWLEARKRMFGFLHEIDRQHQGKTIVVVSHGDPLFVALWALSLKAESQIDEVHYPRYAEAIEARFPAILFKEDGAFDPHRPFIDRLSWPCQHCGQGTKRRIPEVGDAWFDSGSMPLAQWHYPFENSQRLDKGKAYPADFITEGIDQTRGWFYTLLAVATVLQHAKKVPAGPPYAACLVLGHIRDKQGRKLSKSLGNYIDPMTLLEKYGADAVRMYFFTVNQPSEPKNFDEEHVADIVKKTFLILWNVLAFWKLAAGYQQSATSYQLQAASRKPSAVSLMDKWILARLDDLDQAVTKHLERYEIVEAGRSLAAFVTDLSTWYVRRSRERAKTGSEVTETLGYVLREYAKLSAPFTPFFSDAVWRELGNQASVHLEAWPHGHKPDEKVLAEMAEVQQIVETGHAVRAAAKLKVRQPLSQLVLIGMKLGQEFRQIVADELNVKEVHTTQAAPTGQEWKTLQNVSVDSTVTDELREEGYLREMIRAVNALRKLLRLKPGEPAAVVFACDDQAAKYVDHFARKLVEKGSLSSLKRVDVIAESYVVAELDEKKVIFGKG